MNNLVMYHFPVHSMLIQEPGCRRNYWPAVICYFCKLVGEPGGRVCRSVVSP